MTSHYHYGSLPSSASAHDDEHGSLNSSTAAGRFTRTKSGKGAAAALIMIGLGLAFIGGATYGGGSFSVPTLGQPNHHKGRRHPNHPHHPHRPHHPPAAVTHSEPAKANPDSHTESPEPVKVKSSSPCDPDSAGLNGCAYFFTQQSALSAKPSTCPAGEKEEIVPPSWWKTCQTQTGACPAGCGTCKPPDKQAGGQCLCAGSNAVCTEECGYPGQKDDSNTCKTEPCREAKPEEAGCVSLGENCGGSQETDCMDAQGTITKNQNCGFSDNRLNPGQQCIAFCAQVPGTNKCKTTRMQSYVSPGMKDPCPSNQITAVTSEGSANKCSNVGGIVLLDGDFSRCKNPTTCPYDSADLSRECAYANGSNVQIAQDLKDKGVTAPDRTCPKLKNRGSEGFPSFFTNSRVPSDAAVSCQIACACNTRKGFGPPACFISGEPFPGPTACCYCNGKNIAYDTKHVDSCGNYLPIYGEGVLPDQVSIYVL